MPGRWLLPEADLAAEMECGAVLARGARTVAGVAAVVPTCAAPSTQGIQLLGSASSEPICAAQSAKSESNLH